MARKTLVKVTKLLQNVFNETGLDEESSAAAMAEPYREFIRSSIPRFHATVLSITDGDAVPTDGAPGSSLEAAAGSRSAAWELRDSGKVPLRVPFFPSKKRGGETATDEQLHQQTTTKARSASVSSIDEHEARPGSVSRGGNLPALLSRIRPSSASTSSSEEEEDDNSTTESGGGIHIADEGYASVMKHLWRSTTAVTDTRKQAGEGSQSLPRSLSCESTQTSCTRGTASVAKMTSKELVTFLQKHGLAEGTISVIKKKKTTGEAILRMDSPSLQALGVHKLGERKRILKLVRHADGPVFLDGRADVSGWSSEEVAKWATANGFDEYRTLFTSRDVTGVQLVRMDHAQLSDLGVAKWGHRQRMLKLIEESSRAVGPRAVLAWTIDGVLRWLKDQGLEQYQPVFQSRGVTGADLAHLTDLQLVQLGVVSLGHRKRLLRSITTLLNPEAALNGEDDTDLA